jgi:hypothetical protein
MPEITFKRHDRARVVKIPDATYERLRAKADHLLSNIQKFKQMPDGSYLNVATVARIENVICSDALVIALRQKKPHSLVIAYNRVNNDG